MTLAGFRATNHPQQTSKRDPDDAVDDRGTDAAFFAEMHRRFGFTLDVAAAAHNAKCSDYLTLEDDALTSDWKTAYGDVSRVWCNPPYSGLKAWLEKAWEQWTKGHCDLIVMLVPANRTEQVWWQDYVEPFRDGNSKCEYRLSVEFLRGRMRFDRPQAVIGPKGDRPPFGCCLLIWGPR